MQHRPLWLAITGALVVSAGAGLLALGCKDEWTTSCPEALDEVRAAQEATMKLYEEDAINHYERALQLDPDMVIAKVSLAEHLANRTPARAWRLIDEAHAGDLDALTPRERFMVQRAYALRQGRFDEAAARVDGFLRKMPDDAFALSCKAEELWGRGELAATEQLYRHMLESSPNWVVAYNNLGYLAMSQGRFAEAEEHFTSYRFIAPDQANPHDSLGELYVVVGRYDEAVACFEQAVSIRPDFWLSYQHMVLPLSLSGSSDRAVEVVDRAAASGCTAHELVTLSCSADYLQMLVQGSWEKILARDAHECMTSGVGDLVTIIIHRAACETGTWHRALSLETALERALKPARGRPDRPDDIVSEQLEPGLLHMRGVRLALSGDLAKAAEQLRKADQVYTYATSTPGVLKLWNRMMLAHTQHELGNDTETRRIVAEVRAVNPSLVVTYKKAGLGLPD